MGRMQMTEGQEKVHLAFEGDITIENAAELRDSLLRSISLKKGILMELTGLGSVDLSFVQLLASLLQTAKLSDVPLEVKGAIPGHIEQLAQQFGFSDLQNFACKTEGEPDE
ncbi:MAG: STAS domain-containing protein [Desulfovibrionales bacterium]